MASSNYEVGVHTLPPPRPASPVTAGFRLNHLMLRITDPEASLKFYNDCLGMHTVFVFNTGAWTIYYLGPRDVQMKDLGTSKGLLELYHVPDGPKTMRNGNENGGEGFGHIGFTVPDVEKALKRVEEFGYKIIKPLGEAKASQYGVGGVQEGQVAEGYNHVFRQLAFILDPDVSSGLWYVRSLLADYLFSRVIGSNSYRKSSSLQQMYRVWLRREGMVTLEIGRRGIR